MIASKYEEIYPPTAKDFAYITDNAYHVNDIYQMEFKILNAIDFGISQTTAFRFLERYAKVAELDTVGFCLAQYFMELALLDSKMNQFQNSYIALSAIYATQRVLQG